MRTEPRRILFLGDRLGFEGGIERYMFSAAALLREQGVEVTGAFQAAGRDSATFRAGFDRILDWSGALKEAAGFELAALHKPCFSAELTRLRDAFGRRLVFWAHDHEIYCPRRYYYTPFGRRNCHRPCSLLYCPACALLASPRRWQGGSPLGQLRFLFRDMPRRLAELRRTDTVVISEFMRGNLLCNGFDPERVHLISPFIGACQAAPGPACPEEGVRLLFLGQLLRGKGCDLFLEMLRKLEPPFRAVIAGDGNDRPMLEAKCREYGLEQQVRFLGWHSNPEELFAGTDVAVFPFRWQEPFGLCGLESIAHGVPVVAFDLGGVREWLADGETGIAVPPFDVEAMAAAVRKLRGDVALRRRMGDAGRRLAAEKFAPERFLAAFDALCRSRR